MSGHADAPRPDDGREADEADARTRAVASHREGEEPEPDAGSGPVASALAAPTYGATDEPDGVRGDPEDESAPGHPDSAA